MAAGGSDFRNGFFRRVGPFDFLAEITMSILQKQLQRNPETGYARDFVDQMHEVMQTALARDITIISNAGGARPHNCATALAELAGYGASSDAFHVSAPLEDGAGAALLTLGNEGPEILSTHIHTDGANGQDLLLPGGGSISRLPRQIPYAKAMEILLIGDSISAREALEIGLVRQPTPERFSFRSPGQAVDSGRLP